MVQLIAVLVIRTDFATVRFTLLTGLQLSFSGKRAAASIV